MDPSYLKSLLCSGREVEFVYGAKFYTLKLVNYHSTMEYSFGDKWGDKICSSAFDTILYRRDYGITLDEMLRNIDRRDIYIY